MIVCLVVLCVFGFIFVSRCLVFLVIGLFMVVDFVNFMVVGLVEFVYV